MLCAGGGLDRPEPAGVEHITRELAVRLAVVDDQDERARSGRPSAGDEDGTAVSSARCLSAGARRRSVPRSRGPSASARDARDLEVAAVCDDLDSLLAAVESERPDVVMTDIRMPPSNVDEGIQAAERLRETHPDVGVVVLSQYADPTFARTLLEGGALGALTSSRSGCRISSSWPPRFAPSPTAVGDRSEGRRGARGAERSQPRSRRSASSRRASETCCKRWPRARTTRRSRRRSS